MWFFPRQSMSWPRASITLDSMPHNRNDPCLLPRACLGQGRLLYVGCDAALLPSRCCPRLCDDALAKAIHSTGRGASNSWPTYVSDAQVARTGRRSHDLGHDKSAATKRSTQATNRLSKACFKRKQRPLPRSRGVQPKLGTDHFAACSLNADYYKPTLRRKTACTPSTHAIHKADERRSTS